MEINVIGCACKYNMKSWKYNWISDTISYYKKAPVREYLNLLYCVYGNNGEEWQFIYNNKFTDIECPKCISRANNLKTKNLIYKI